MKNNPCYNDYGGKKVVDNKSLADLVMLTKVTICYASRPVRVEPCRVRIWYHPFRTGGHECNKECMKFNPLYG